MITKHATLIPGWPPDPDWNDPSIVKTLVWKHKNGRTYRRKLRSETFVLPANCVQFSVQMTSNVI